MSVISIDRIKISRSDGGVDAVQTTDFPALKMNGWRNTFIRVKVGLIALGFGIQGKPVIVFRDEAIQELPNILIGGSEKLSAIFEKKGKHAPVYTHRAPLLTTCFDAPLVTPGHVHI